VRQVRSVCRALGAPLRWVLIGLLRVYGVTLSGWLGGQCRFYPSCSRYAEEAIRSHGAVKGTGLAIWRVLRCNPFGAGGVEHIPDHPAYDSTIHGAGRGAAA
jgi:putative membrane protein insertion efficiency factor